MPAINLECNVKQGYDFKKDSKETVGYITEMIVGGRRSPPTRLSRIRSVSI